MKFDEGNSDNIPVDAVVTVRAYGTVSIAVIEARGLKDMYCQTMRFLRPFNYQHSFAALAFEKAGGKGIQKEDWTVDMLDFVEGMIECY